MKYRHQFLIYLRRAGKIQALPFLRHAGGDLGAGGVVFRGDGVITHAFDEVDGYRPAHGVFGVAADGVGVAELAEVAAGRDVVARRPGERPGTCVVA